MDPRKSRSRRKLSQYALALVHQAIAPQGGLSFGRCPLLAQSGHAELHCTCPLLAVKRTSIDRGLRARMIGPTQRVGGNGLQRTQPYAVLKGAPHSSDVV